SWRCARFEIEGVAAHHLLRYLLGLAEMRNIIDARMGNGFTACHMAAFYVGYTAVRLLVEAGADASIKTPHGSSCMSMLLERARQPQSGFLDADRRDRWRKSAYRAALFLSEKLRGKKGDWGLSPLHIAAYIGKCEEVERLLQVEGADVRSTN